MSAKAKSLGKGALGCAVLFGATLFVAGCSSSNPASPRVYIVSDVQPGHNGSANCGFGTVTPVINVGSATNSIQSGDSQNGDPVGVTCSVTPAANSAFTLSLTAQLRGQGSVFIQGTVTNDHSNPQTGLSASFDGMGLNFTENAGASVGGMTDPGCTLDFTGNAINMGDPNMGVFPGRIWANITCPTAGLQDGTRTCQGDAQFKFENCAGSPSS